MPQTDHMPAAPGTAWPARLVLLAIWPTAWWLIQATLRAWSGAADSPLTVDSALGLVVAAVGSMFAAYLAISTLLLAIARLREHGPAPAWLQRCTPQLWRKVVGAALGGALGATMATASFAADVADPAPPAATVTSAGWVATPATATSTGEAAPFAPPIIPATGQAASPQSGGGQTVTVRRGDSLWVICADLLPAAATESDIAQAWPLLYRANKHVIGDNPSLIYAGQTLDVPADLLS